MLNLVFGVLMTVCGFASTIYGNYMNNDFSSQLAHYDSDIDPGFAWILGGILAVVLGICLIVAGCDELKPGKNNKVIFFCPKCKSTYGEDSGTRNYCPDCNAPLVETKYTRDYWRSLTDAEKDNARKKLAQEL